MPNHIIITYIFGHAKQLWTSQLTMIPFCFWLNTSDGKSIEMSKKRLEVGISLPKYQDTSILRNKGILAHTCIMNVSNKILITML